MTRWLAAAVLGAWIGASGLGMAEAQSSAPRPRPATPGAGGTARAAQTAPKSAPASGKGQPVTVDADQLVSDQKQGLVIFTGNVVARHNNSTQYADRMEVYLDEKGDKVMRTVSTGGVRIITRDCRTGTAQRAEYYDAEQRVVLTGDARVWQEENVVTGERITIFLAEDRSMVEGGAGGRVKGIFYPKREGEASPNGKPAAGAPCKPS
jgi:lipopolysaccharide export system protein LptA